MTLGRCCDLHGVCERATRLRAGSRRQLLVIRRKVARFERYARRQREYLQWLQRSRKGGARRGARTEGPTEPIPTGKNVRKCAVAGYDTSAITSAVVQAAPIEVRALRIDFMIQFSTRSPTGHWRVLVEKREQHFRPPVDSVNEISHRKWCVTMLVAEAISSI